jgi:2'-5' RNA ligase
MDMLNHHIPHGTQRVFIGIPIDNQSQQHINELLKPIKDSRQDIRWVPENNRHLTLAFLGNRPISEVDNLIQQFDESYQQETRFQYRLSTLERFPDPAGRIIALTNEPAGSLDELFQVTLKLLQRNEIEFSRKKFRPHVTLGRIKRPKHVKKTFDQQININLDITKITLYQSTLSESGSIYLPLKEIQLNNVT